MSAKSKTPKLETPLATARGLGAAHGGVHHWISLRVSAIAAIPLCVWLVYSVLCLRGASYEAFRAWLAEPVNAILMILFILAVFYHAALGCREIVEDYVHNKGLKYFKLITLNFFFLAGAVACVFSVLKIAFAGGE